MAANTVNIALPDPLRAYVEERVAEGDYATPSEFIRSLIREDRERRRERLETVLLEALETRPLEVDPEGLHGRSLVSVLREKLAHS
jgi:antitoxin ParD1/3/4